MSFSAATSASRRKPAATITTRLKCRPTPSKGKVRINKAGCLDRCDEGPVLVVYPDAVWYTYVDKHDVDEVIDSHVIHGRIVERLKI